MVSRNGVGAWLRLAGLLLLGIAAAAAWRLFANAADAAGGVTATACALALIAFLAASAGSALVVLGRHLFDQVPVSARWAARRPGPQRRDRG